jgi:hypothetical protein
MFFYLATNLLLRSDDDLLILCYIDRTYGLKEQKTLTFTESSDLQENRL